jgi:phospholipid N-methyltransferase
MADHSAFLSAFLRAPVGIGAVAPSSAALARQMVSSAAIAPDHVIVELGAGTGPMTRALRQQHPNNPLLVLEPDPKLAAVCRERTPGVDVVEAYAQDLPRLLAERGLGKADRVVSSLPFAGWSAELQDAVFAGILAACAEDARMVTFTYVHSPWLPAGARAKARLEREFQRVTSSPTVWCNMPPAFVYVCDQSLK